MKPLGVTLFLLSLVAAGPAAGGEAARIFLSPESDGFWRAEFRLQAPAKELVLIRPSESGRIARTVFDDPHFEMTVRGEQAVIRRKDGDEFTRVSLREPATYYTDFVGYLPYSPFGDGGVLVHTGRFHACAEPCPVDAAGDEGPWRMTIDPRGTRMIVDGKATRRRKTVSDGGDGSAVYVGDGAIIEGASFLAVIDSSAPADLVDHLNKLFPELMDIFAARLSPPSRKQMLFLSYNVPGSIDGYSIKGGTLPDQVFMHFEGAGVAEHAGEAKFFDFLSWFFSHEAAHLHQNLQRSRRSVQFAEGDSWIHEGGADALAYVALAALQRTSPQYRRSRLDGALDACAKALETGPLFDIHKRGDFQTYYDCGLILHLAAAAGAAKTDRDLFTLWNAFTEEVSGGAPWTTETYLSVVADISGADVAGFMRSVVRDDLADPRGTLETGIKAWRAIEDE
jgi:hypothetical protein